MKFLLLSEKPDKDILKFLSQRGSVNFIKEKIDENTLINYDWIISFGYRHILSKQIVSVMKNKIINLHISYLPYNRGADPNYWSFKENTPKGVSIHFIDEGIDTGSILVQRLCTFSEEDTLKSSYNKLIKYIKELFYENFDKITEGLIIPKPQLGKGTFHKKTDLKETINYNIKISKI